MHHDKIVAFITLRAVQTLKIGTWRKHHKNILDLNLCVCVCFFFFFFFFFLRFYLQLFHPTFPVKEGNYPH